MTDATTVSEKMFERSLGTSPTMYAIGIAGAWLLMFAGTVEIVVGAMTEEHLFTSTGGGLLIGGFWMFLYLLHIRGAQRFLERKGVQLG